MPTLRAVAGPARLALVVVLALAPLAACTSDGDGGAASETTVAGDATTTTEASRPTAVVDVPGLDCGALAADGPPASTGPSAVPRGPVTFTGGPAVVLLTPEGGEQRCLALQLSGDLADPQLLDAEAQVLDLRWEDGGLALHLAVADSPIAPGPVEAAVDVEVDGATWSEASTSACAVALTAVDASSVDGTVTCTALPSATEGDGAVAVLAAFHAEV